MPRLGLALSGGGFRATLFHLGVLRFLKDAGQLKDVTDIASVSGGSILAAHLALNWDRYTGDDKQFDEAASEIVKFVQFDVRNYIVRRLPLQFPVRLLAKLVRRPVRKLTANALLERCYEKRLFGDRCLYELPEKPLLHILATNVSNGGLTVFNRNGLYIQQRRDGDDFAFDHILAKMASIPRAVGASSAFPGFFPPVGVTAADLGVREGEFRTEYFTDGGVYDNLGIRAFYWLKHQGEQFDEVVVSDAGQPFQVLDNSALSFLGQSVRASDILWDRVWQLERDNFIKQEGFLFLQITATVEANENPTLHPVIQSEVQSIRTDLDCFSDEEVNALAQHGYEVARKAYRERHGSEVFPRSDQQPWAPVPEKRLPAADVPPPPGSAPASPPTSVSRRLRSSSIRRVWSTLLDFRDWPTYVYLALAAFLFGYLPLQVYQLYHRAQVLTTINDAIAQGDPDIRRVLDLVTKDPTTTWTADSVQVVPQQSDVDYSGIEMLTHSRIIDLRRWRPNAADPDNRGQVYLTDRVELRLTDSYRGDRKIIIQFPIAVDNVDFRQPRTDRRALIRRVSEPFDDFGVEKTLYEFEYDLQGIPLGEPVTLEMDMLLDVPQSRSRASFTMRMKTDLVSMWMLFPEERPYRTYSLVQYPADRSASPNVLESRYKIDHPYGNLIGWSVVNPKPGNVYECRWSYD